MKKLFSVLLGVCLMSASAFASVQDADQTEASQVCRGLSGTPQMTTDAFSGEEEVLCSFAQGLSCGQLQLLSDNCSVDLTDAGLRNQCTNAGGELVMYEGMFVSCDFGNEVVCTRNDIAGGICDPLESDFEDVENHEFAEAVKYVEREGIVEGYEDKTYRPDSHINRAEFTKIIVEALFEPGQFDPFHLGECFPDVAAGEWYTRYVCFAKDQGIINGNADGTFKPASMINYAEALKIVVEAYERDTSEVSAGVAWYDKYLNFAARNYLSFAGTMSPGDPVTRGQMAAMIYWLDFL